MITSLPKVDVQQFVITIPIYDKVDLMDVAAPWVFFRLDGRQMEREGRNRLSGG